MLKLSEKQQRVINGGDSRPYSEFLDHYNGSAYIATVWINLKRYRGSLNYQGRVTGNGAYSYWYAGTVFLAL